MPNVVGSGMTINSYDNSITTPWLPYDSPKNEYTIKQTTAIKMVIMKIDNKISNGSNKSGFFCTKENSIRFFVEQKY